MDSSTLSVKDLFDRAVELNSARDREAFLDTSCAAAPALRREVEELLRSYDQAGGFLEPPTLDLDPAIAGLNAGSARTRNRTPWTDRLIPVLLCREAKGLLERAAGAANR
jgi:hypothetical protein